MEETKFPYEQDDYYRFAFVADEWLTEYAFQSGGVISLPALTFSFAMTLELYLKAYFTRLTNDGLGATKYSHRIDKLLKEIESIDPYFPDILKFNLNLLDFPIFELDRKHWDTEWYNKLPQNEKQSLRDNYEFYLIMAYGPDLKYGISPSLEKHNGRIISSAWTHFNNKLKYIIIYIRNRIEYPINKVDDNLYWSMKNPRQSKESLNYIEEIMLQTKYIETN